MKQFDVSVSIIRRYTIMAETPQMAHAQAVSDFESELASNPWTPYVFVESVDGVDVSGICACGKPILFGEQHGIDDAEDIICSDCVMMARKEPDNVDVVE